MLARVVVRILAVISLVLWAAGSVLAQSDPPWRAWHPKVHEPPWPRESRPLISPDGRARVHIRYDHIPNARFFSGGIVVSTLFLSQGGGAPRAVYRSRLRDRQELLSPKGVPLGPMDLSKFMVVSWTPDSAGVLLLEVLIQRYTDWIEEVPFYYHTRSGAVRYATLVTLLEAVQRHWATRWGGLADRQYQVELLGWEGRSASRVLFRADEIYVPDARFLGYWSTALDGGTVRLVSERKGAVRPQPFGTPAPGR